MSGIALSFVFVRWTEAGPSLASSSGSQAMMDDSCLLLWSMAPSFSMAQEVPAYRPPEVSQVELRPPSPGGHLEQWLILAHVLSIKGVLSSSKLTSLLTEPSLFPTLCILEEADGLIDALLAALSSSSTGRSVFLSVLLLSFLPPKLLPMSRPTLWSGFAHLGSSSLS